MGRIAAAFYDLFDSTAENSEDPKLGGNLYHRLNMFYFSYSI